MCPNGRPEVRHGTPYILTPYILTPKYLPYNYSKLLQHFVDYIQRKRPLQGILIKIYVSPFSESFGE